VEKKIKKPNLAKLFLGNFPPPKETGSFLFISIEANGEQENTVLNQLFV